MNDKPVLFASFRPLERSENIRAIYDAYPGKKVHICSTSSFYRYEVLSGKYDIMVTDDFPAISPGICIMIWHAIQGGKKIGLDQPGNPFFKKEMKDRISWIITAGMGSMPMWESATGVNLKNILPWGLPVTDEYIGKKKGDGHTFLAEKKSYLFVPTFRDRNETSFPQIDWDYLDSILTDDELFVVKAHPWQLYQGRINQIAMPYKPYKHIQVVPESEPSAPYLYDADVIVTDYSSIMFDGYLLNKPSVLFEKTPGYTKARGMYLQYPTQYSSRYATNETELVQLMRDALMFGMGYTERRCREIVAEACDGRACERIFDLIESKKGVK